MERIEDALINKSSNTSKLGLKQDPRKTFMGDFGGEKKLGTKIISMPLIQNLNTACANI